MADSSEDSSAALELKLQREVTCLFCQGELDDPRLLECLHFYCKNCIYHMRIANTEHRYKCPQCTDTLHIEDINKLHSFTLAKVKTRNLHILRKVTQENPLCDLCLVNNSGKSSGRRLIRSSSTNGGAEPALYICTDCRDGQQFLCHSCSMPHYHRPEYNDHELELVTNFHSSITPTLPKVRNRRSTMAASLCHNHGLQFHFFCQSCSVGLCNDCLPSHSTHNITETGNAIEDAQRLVAEELLDIVQAREVLSSSIKPIEEVKKAIGHQAEFVIGEIESRFVRINREIDFSQKKLVNQLNSVSQSKQNVLQQQIHQIHVLIEKVDRLANLMSQTAAMPDEAVLMSLVNLFIEKAHSLKNEYTTVLTQSSRTSAAKIATIKNQVSLVPCERANMALLLHPEEVKTALRDSGIYIKTAYPPNCIAYGPGISSCPVALNLTYFNIQLFNENHIPSSQFHDVKVKINIQTTGGSTLNEKPKIVHKRQGKYIVSYCPRVSGQATINVTVDDNDIQGSPFIVPIYSASPLSPDASNFSIIKELQYPKCLTIDSEGGHLLVCDENGKLIIVDMNSGKVESIFKFDLKSINGIDVMKDNSLSLSSSFSSSHSPSASSSISPSRFTSQQKYVYVTSSTDHCIAKLSLKDGGKMLEQIGSRGTGESQFDTPVGILAVKQEVFVCDSLNHRVQIFDGQDLGYKRKIEVDFSSLNNTHLTFPGQPIDITINENNNLLISDAKNNCILLFTSQEKYRSLIWQVTRVIRSEEQDRLLGPCGLCCDGDGYLYVSDSGKNNY